MDVRIEDPAVSEWHAVLVPDGSDLILLDRKSTFGVTVNGVPTARTGLVDGDVVLLASGESWARTTSRSCARSPPRSRSRFRWSPSGPGCNRLIGDTPVRQWVIHVPVRRRY
jgi:hypothetical protein